jgi:phosphate transport system substrate-binding protein
MVGSSIRGKSAVSSRSVIARLIATVAGALALVLPPIGHTAQEYASVKGTGGSSAAHVLAQWNFQFTKETKINVAFAPATSGVGIREMIARNVDFGATEIPLSAEELKKNDLIQFPLLIGGVVVVVNIPGVEPGAMRLSSNLISKIYQGEIKFWNNDEIRAENAKLNLPKLPIKLVVRETAASTTLALTTFLAQTDRAWATRIGAKDKPEWPAAALKVPTVQAMSQTVQSTPGAIGYLNIDEAYRTKLTHVQLRNRAGNYLKPSRESILSAATTAGISRSADKTPNLINVEGVASWPIVEITYVLIDRVPKTLDRSRSTLKFFYWAFMQGDAMAAETGFVPLPTTMQARVVGRFREVLAPDHTPIDFLK